MRGIPHTGQLELRYSLVSLAIEQQFRALLGEFYWSSLFWLSVSTFLIIQYTFYWGSSLILMLALCLLFSYLFNLVCQFMSSRALQDQCRRMISIMLKMFMTNPSTETTHILGEQLQVSVFHSIMVFDSSTCSCSVQEHLNVVMLVGCLIL